MSPVPNRKEPAETAFRFIESKDIREHLRKTGFEFAARDIACLIWNCGSLSVEERHRELQALSGVREDPALSACLDLVIRFEKRLLARFTRPGGGSYSCVVYLTSGETWADDRLFDLPEDFLREYTQAANLMELEIRRKVDDMTIYALMLPDGRITSICADGRSEEERHLKNAMGAFSFAFPCPFETGDYLEVIRGEGIFAGQPMRYLGSRFEPGLGMIADCECVDSNGNICVFGIPLLELERSSLLRRGGSQRLIAGNGTP